MRSIRNNVSKITAIVFGSKRKTKLIAAGAIGLAILGGYAIIRSQPAQPRVGIDAKPAVKLDAKDTCTEKISASQGIQLQSDGQTCGSLKSFTLTDPVANASLSGTKVLAAVDDPLHAAARVDFLIDEQARVAVKALGWNYSWNTATVANGSSHSISAKAYDSSNTLIGTTAVVTVSVSQLPVTSRTTCTVSAALVNSCRPWLGAYVGSYGQSNFRTHIEDHERRIGRQLDMVHSYYPTGSVPLNANDKYFVSRPNTILYATFKPSDTWAQAGGGNASVNSKIDQAADSIKSVSPRKVMVGIFHEPENDVSSGVNCANLKGHSGSPADYRAMWRNVRNRFNTRGVTNVVWVMNYMGYRGWDCMVKDLWPGNDLVDWIMWDPYVQDNNFGFADAVSPFYNWMQNNSDSGHAFTSKAWGLAEWGVFQADTAHTYKAYQDAQAMTTNPAFGRLKAYNIFDTINNGDFRISYNNYGILDLTEQTNYKNFASSHRFVGNGQ